MGGWTRTLLELLQALKGDLELIRRVERGRVVLDLDTEQRDDRHGDGGADGALEERRATVQDDMVGVIVDAFGIFTWMSMGASVFVWKGSCCVKAEGKYNGPPSAARTCLHAPGSMRQSRRGPACVTCGGL